MDKVSDVPGGENGFFSSCPGAVSRRQIGEITSDACPYDFVLKSKSQEPDDTVSLEDTGPRIRIEG